MRHRTAEGRATPDFVKFVSQTVPVIDRSYLLAAGLSLRQAVPIANRAGGIVVGKFGTATVSHAELFAPA